MPRFSVVIPCFRDEKKLTDLLCQLQNLPITSGCRLLEVIVVDGASTLKCCEVCNRYGAYWVPDEPCRGQQLTAGAAFARGDALWFLHADARLPENPLAAMNRAFEQGAIGGYFSFRFGAPRAWPALLLEPAIALRCRLGVPYGDQGLFMARGAYIEAGGHSPWPLFEEVALVRRLRGAGRFVALREPLFIDPRRWHRDGWWRRTWINRSLALAFARGVQPERLADRYRYKTSTNQS
jgi:rSAM/selenodomain-associated transferase 2